MCKSAYDAFLGPAGNIHVVEEAGLEVVQTDEQ